MLGIFVTYKCGDCADVMNVGTRLAGKFKAV